MPGRTPGTPRVPSHATMAAVSEPAAAETPAETRGHEIRTADLVATALTRYAQAFATFGLMALVAAAFPALVVIALREADARAEIIVTVGSFAAAAAALALAGAMTAFIGQRLRRTLPGIVADGAARGAAVRRRRDLPSRRHLPRAPAARRRSGSRPSPRAPGTARAGRPSGARWRSAGTAATAARWCRARSLASFAAILFLAFGIALSPVGGRVRVIATLILWAAVAWPIAGLMLRSLYGALSGRLVVRLRA